MEKDKSKESSITIRWKQFQNDVEKYFNKFVISINSNNKKLNALLYADDKNIHEGVYKVKYFYNFENIDLINVTVTAVSSLGHAVASKKSIKINTRKFFLYFSKVTINTIIV